MRFPPKEVVDSWPEPNYVDPEVRGPAFIIVQSILLAISTTFLCMRMYARVYITRARLGLDDIFIMLGWVRPPFSSIGTRNGQDEGREKELKTNIRVALCRGPHNRDNNSNNSLRLGIPHLGPQTLRRRHVS